MAKSNIVFKVDKVNWNVEGDAQEVEHLINKRAAEGYMFYRMFSVNYRAVNEEGDKVDMLLITVDSNRLTALGGQGS